uniref:interleukin-1 receptor accessory protein-like 1 n=1 Tax=Myxine glutinosa TaxID=7769 RepID=UPI00358DFDD3
MANQAEVCCLLSAVLVVACHYRGIQLFWEEKTLLNTAGQTVSLTCQAYFGYSGGVSPSIYWMKGDSFIEELDPKRIYENETRVLHEWLGEQRVALRLVLNSIQVRDLGNYTCIVANGRGKRHGTVLLRQHEPPSVLQLAVGLSAMLLLLGAGVALYRCHRVELALCYRQHCGLDETRGDNKEYDAFVSCAKADGGAWGGEGAEDEHLALELIPDVLEKHFGFRLFLPERDLIPANTYVEDVSRAIELSRRLILLLTPSYVLRRGWSLFQIEEGLRMMLEGGQTKVIIIECGELRGVVNYHEVEALRAGIKSVVTVRWKGASSGHLGSHFWKKLRYAMPAKKPDTRGDSEPCLDEAEASPFQSLHTVAENVGPVTSLSCRMDTRASVCNPCYARYGSGTRVARVFGETSPRILDNHHTYCNIPLSLVNGHRAKASGAPFGSAPLATATLGHPRRDFAPEESQGNSAVLPLLPRAPGTSSVIW